MDNQGIQHSGELALHLEFQKKDKKIDYAIAFSVILHILLFIIFSRARMAENNYEDLKQITLIDQTYRPEVAKILKKEQMPGSDLGRNKGITPKSPTIVPTQEAPIEGEIDLSQRLDRSQAVIDLNRYESSNSHQMDVIRIGDASSGNQKSIEELLLEKPVALSRGLSRGPGNGLAGIPGVGVSEEPEISIEHRSLEKTTLATSVVPKTTKREIAQMTAEPVELGTNISIAGPISRRQILSKYLPQYPEWALKRGISGTAVIRLWVLPDGTVKETMTIEQSSGYPELDQLVIKALRRWLFAPLEKDMVQEVQWGIITFKFCLT